jgi:hypothetical protein
VTTNALAPAAFRTIVDPRGRLTVVEGAAVPFPVKRVFFISDVVPGGERGGHAHRELHQFIVCQTGALTVTVDDGRGAPVGIRLSPGQGLHVPPMWWAVEREFAAGTVYLVLASHPYDERDYFRDRADFIAAVASAGTR